KFSKLQTVKANMGLKKHDNKNSPNTGMKCGKTQTEHKCKQRMHHNKTDYAKSTLDCFETHSRFFKRGWSGRGERLIADGFPASSLQQLERHDRPQSLRRGHSSPATKIASHPSLPDHGHGSMFRPVAAMRLGTGVRAAAWFNKICN